MLNHSASFDELPAQYKNAANLAARQRIYRFALTGNPPWMTWVFDQLKLPPAARILELGCGNAELWKQNLHRIPAGWKIILSDAFPGMLNDARQSLGHLDPRFEFQNFDAQSIPFPDQSFDAVIANHMLYHVPDRPRAFAEIHRVLCPGGTLFAATNGLAHLAALTNLLDRFVPTPPQPTASHKPFSLDNGHAQLSPFFSEVTLHRFTGHLKVTDPQAIVDYALSIEHAKPILINQKLQDFRAVIDQKISLHGSFQITTESGVFHAVKHPDNSPATPPQ